MILSVLRRGSRRRQKDPRIEAAIELTHQIVDDDNWFDPQALDAKGWQVVPLVWGVSEVDRDVFLKAARARSVEFIDIDLDMHPLACSIDTWTQETLADTRDSAAWRLRISCSQEFALLSQGFEFSFIAGSPEFLKQCLPSGVNKMWQVFLEYAADPEWTVTPRASFDRLARIYGSPETIEAFAHIDVSPYTRTSPEDQNRAIVRARETVETPGGFKRGFLQLRRWDAIPTFYGPNSFDAEILCGLSKDREDSGLNVVFLKCGEPTDVLFIPLDSSVLWRLFLNKHRDQMLIYPPSENWFFLKNNVPCHVLAAGPALAKIYAKELETSWQDIRNNRNSFKQTIEAQLQYNDLGTRYEVTDWEPFKEGGVEIPSPRKPRRSFIHIIANYFS